MVFHEAPRALSTTLDDLSEAGPDRRIALCRVVSIKLHHETIRTTLGGRRRLLPGERPQGRVCCRAVARQSLWRAPGSRWRTAWPKGELKEQGLGMKDAVWQAAEETGLARNSKTEPPL